MNLHFTLICISVGLIAPAVVGAEELLEPTPIIVRDEVLDVEHEGHAAPFVGDFNNDGVKDLLVGEYYKGRLRIYPNVGTNTSPRFDAYHVFQDGAPQGCIHAS